MNSAIEKLKGVFEVGRSALQALLYLIVLVVALVMVFSASARGRIAVAVTDMAAAGVESVKFAGTELKLRERVKEREQALVACVNNPPPAPQLAKKIANDVQPSAMASSALQLIAPPPTFWTYVGQYQNGTYLGKPNYDTNKVPREGEPLVARTATYKRANQPQNAGNDEWKLGQIIGVVKEGQQITVQAVETVEGGNVWVRATASAASGN
jgi:hypothetical protein